MSKKEKEVEVSYRELCLAKFAIPEAVAGFFFLYTKLITGVYVGALAFHNVFVIVTSGAATVTVVRRGTRSLH